MFFFVSFCSAFAFSFLTLKDLTGFRLELHSEDAPRGMMMGVVKVATGGVKKPAEVTDRGNATVLPPAKSV